MTRMPDAFQTLLESQTTPEQRERLHRARQELALSSGDAIWGFVQVVQDYCASLGPGRQPDPISSAPKPTWVFRPWQLVSAGLALQTLALSCAFCIGQHWSSAPIHRSTVDWVRAVLAVPAGWMLFLHVLPLLAQGAWASWLARKHDRLVGWALLCLFVGAIAACALTLSWLLS
jgi:hypothetical protein